MIKENDKYQAIVDIINVPFKGKEHKPNIYGKHIFQEKALILLDMPRKGDAFHGSSYVFSCHKDICSTNGEIIVNREDEKDTSNQIIEAECNVKEIHRHPEEILFMIPGKVYKKESHIHFTCGDKNYHKTLRIAKFLSEF